jgi:ribonucleoside-diphosphate reductase alpha chain
MMDCDTTGIEPDIALVKYKLLAGKGEGMLKIVNQTVPEALDALGYTEAERDAILAFVDEHDTIEGAPALKEAHLPVFDCAFKPHNGQRSIHYGGHVRMMAACQPFISGAISKTVNLPEDATVEDIAQTYVEGWKLGLKAVAIYRENSKRSQPLATKAGGNTKGRAAEVAEPVAVESSGDGSLAPPPVIEKVIYKPQRKRLPDERPSVTHKFSVAGHEGYLHIGLYPDTMMPGEIFITMAKQGSTVSGLMDAFATSASIALQYGVPLEDLVTKFSHMRFEPAGFTNNRQIPSAKSLMDYIFRYLGMKFLQVDTAEPAINPKVAVAEVVDRSGPALDVQQASLFEQQAAAVGGGAEPSFGATFQNQQDAPPCYNCGTITVRAGACYACPSCGASNGCG